jgi:RNA polymerase sigma-32 factor
MDKRRVSGETSHSPALLARYIRDLRRCKPMTREYETTVAKEYQRTNDPALAKQLVEANLRLVIKIAREADRTHRQPLDDLVQEGTLGLIQAIRKYQPTKGASLSTYAGIWIRAYVMKHIMDNVRIVRAVRTREQRMAFFRGIVAGAEVSIDAPRANGTKPIDDVPDDQSPTAEEAVEAAELLHRLREEISQLKSRLTPREVAILDERLLAEQPESLRVVGQRLSLSGERVRQIELRLLQSFANFAPGAARPAGFARTSA